MFAFIVTIPLMALGVGIAVLPVLVGSMRHDRAMRSGELPTLQTATQEADFWHHMLGHRRVEDFAPTPDLIEDDEVIRVGVPTERRVSVEPSVWKTPAFADG
jgi:hypothetical protein